MFSVLLFFNSLLFINYSLYDGVSQGFDFVPNFHVLDYFSGTSSCPHMVIDNLKKKKIKGELNDVIKFTSRGLLLSFKHDANFQLYPPNTKK